MSRIGYQVTYPNDETRVMAGHVTYTQIIRGVVWTYHPLRDHAMRIASLIGGYKIHSK